MGLRTSGIDRIIDANANRLKEGLRVCEEVARFILDDRKLTAGLKKIRHEADAALDSLTDRGRCISARDSVRDTGRRIHTVRELKRSGANDIFGANIQRAKESIRVLEEFSKIDNRKCALAFKDLRYRIYEIEKQAVTSLRAAEGREAIKTRLRAS